MEILQAFSTFIIIVLIYGFIDYVLTTEDSKYENMKPLEKRIHFLSMSIDIFCLTLLFCVFKMSF